jgi:hypothetical protein
MSLAAKLENVQMHVSDRTVIVMLHSMFVLRRFIEVSKKSQCRVDGDAKSRDMSIYI